MVVSLSHHRLAACLLGRPRSSHFHRAELAILGAASMRYGACSQPHYLRQSLLYNVLYQCMYIAVGLYRWMDGCMNEGVFVGLHVGEVRTVGCGPKGLGCLVVPFLWHGLSTCRNPSNLPELPKVGPSRYVYQLFSAPCPPSLSHSPSLYTLLGGC